MEDKGIAQPAAGPDGAPPPATSSQPGAEIAQAGEERLVRIESLRALAAVGVVIAHVWGTTGGSFFIGFENRAISGIGFGGLMFFTLSGALLYMPYVRRDFGGGRDISLRRYAFNRALRIFPAYYVALAVVLLVQEGGGTLHQWVTFGLFLENFDYSTVGLVNGALWTTVIELHFYILLPFLAYGIAGLSKGSVKRALLIIGALALASVCVHLFAVILTDRPWRDPLRFSLISYFYFVAAGMIVALLRHSWDRRPAWVRGPLLSADLWLIASVPFWFLFVIDYSLQSLFVISCFLVMGAFLLPLRPSVVTRLVEWKPVAVLGLASFSLYLWHVPLLHFVNTHRVPIIDPLINKTNEFVGSDFIAFGLIMVPFCCAFAFLSYALVERPVLRLRQRWDSSRREARVERRGAEQPQEATALAAAE